jgi:hypothetical protein
MTWRSISLVAVVLLGAACDAPAQNPPVGTIAFTMKVSVPDSMRSKIPVGDAIELTMTLMSDGHRYAADIATGASMTVMPGMHVRTVFSVDHDTLHAAAILPPELAAMTGGAPGFRMDIPTSMFDSLAHAAKGMFDSLGKTMADSIRKMIPTVKPRSLGTTAVVAGLRCEEWQTVTGVDTISMCLIPTPPAIQGMKDHFLRMSGMQDMVNQIPGLADLVNQAYGGRKMTAIRTVFPKYGMRVELTSFSAATPDSTMFAVPANLQAVPMPNIPKKIGGASTGQQ